MSYVSDNRMQSSDEWEIRKIRLCLLAPVEWMSKTLAFSLSLVLLSFGEEVNWCQQISAAGAHIPEEQQEAPGQYVPHLNLHILWVASGNTCLPSSFFTSSSVTSFSYASSSFLPHLNEYYSAFQVDFKFLYTPEHCTLMMWLELRGRNHFSSFLLIFISFPFMWKHNQQPVMSVKCQIFVPWGFHDTLSLQ